jgi:hypothetical protein
LIPKVRAKGRTTNGLGTGTDETIGMVTIETEILGRIGTEIMTKGIESTAIAGKTHLTEEAIMRLGSEAVLLRATYLKIAGITVGTTGIVRTAMIHTGTSRGPRGLTHLEINDQTHLTVSQKFPVFSLVTSGLTLKYEKYGLGTCLKISRRTRFTPTSSFVEK